MKKLYYFLTIVLCLFITISCSTESTPVYTLSTAVTPTEAGAVTPGGGEYDEGETVEITATANDHWVFKGWDGDASGSTNPTTMTMNGNKDIAAVFVKKEYPLTVDTEGEGSVSETVIQPKTTDHEAGTIIELSGSAADGWAFAEWTGDITGSDNPIQITIDEAKEVTGVFERKEFTLTVTTEGEGAVNESLISGTETENGYLFESEIELTADPVTGWSFVEWSGDLEGSENQKNITINESKDVTAIFEMLTYSVTITEPDNGSIVLSPQKDNYSYNEEVELTATADDGYEFTGWGGDLSGSANPETINMTSDLSVSANFKTPEEGAVYQLGGGVYINGRVHSATLNLYNTLSETINLTKVVLKNQNDNQITQNTDGANIEPGERIGFTVSFGIQPTEEDFSNYTVEWTFEYKGETYTKVNKVGESESFKMKDQPVDKIIEHHIE